MDKKFLDAVKKSAREILAAEATVKNHFEKLGIEPLSLSVKSDVEKSPAKSFSKKNTESHPRKR